MDSFSLTLAIVSALVVLTILFFALGLQGSKGFTFRGRFESSEPKRYEEGSPVDLTNMPGLVGYQVFDGERWRTVQIPGREPPKENVCHFCNRTSDADPDQGKEDA